MTEHERIRLEVAFPGELVELPVGPNQKMWIRVSPEQAATVRQTIAEHGPGVRFIADTPDADADPLAKLIAAMANHDLPEQPDGLDGEPPDGWTHIGFLT